jgi:hypothetical protein
MIWLSSVIEVLELAMLVEQETMPSRPLEICYLLVAAFFSMANVPLSYHWSLGDDEMVIAARERMVTAGPEVVIAGPEEMVIAGHQSVTAGPEEMVIAGHQRVLSGREMVIACCETVVVGHYCCADWVKTQFWQLDVAARDPSSCFSAFFVSFPRVLHVNTVMVNATAAAAAVV